MFNIRDSRPMTDTYDAQHLPVGVQRRHEILLHANTLLQQQGRSHHALTHKHLPHHMSERVPCLGLGPPWESGSGERQPSMAGA